MSVSTTSLREAPRVVVRVAAECRTGAIAVNRDGAEEHSIGPALKCGRGPPNNRAPREHLKSTRERPGQPAIMVRVASPEDRGAPVG